MEINNNFAQNLIRFRKARNLTQAEFAEKINYSDKAVSKWERAESVPDIYVLKQIADYFGTTVDALISPQKAVKSLHNISKKRILISLFSASLVWLVAIISYFFQDLIWNKLEHSWIIFIYALPVTFTILLVLFSVWGKNLGNFIILSLLVWTAILSVYFSLHFFVPKISTKLWEIFLIGIPLQILCIIYFTYKRIDKKQ